jgi:hypothetical protein
MSTAQPSDRQLPGDGTRALIDPGPVAERAVSGYYDPDSAAYDDDIADVEGHGWADRIEDLPAQRELVIA